MDGQAVGRMVPSLPYIDGIPVEGGLRVRLTTARAVLEVGKDAVTLSAVRRGLRQLQYRPEVLDGCLTGTGLQRQPP
jgi:hypothetical protein